MIARSEHTGSELPEREHQNSYEPTESEGFVFYHGKEQV